MKCPNCGSQQIAEYPAVATRRGEIFTAQSFYSEEKVTTLAPCKRCTACGNQDFARRNR